MPNPSPTILLIEDDQPTRELYKRELSPDYKVLACATENEALAFLQSQPVRVIILEPALHNGDGWQFLSTLHHMLLIRTIPIILCSTLDEKRRGLELGATFYLIKPVLPTTLLNVINQVIRSSAGN